MFALSIVTRAEKVLNGPKGILKLDTITIEQVSRTRGIGIALLHLVMCGNLRENKE